MVFNGQRQKARVSIDDSWISEKAMWWEGLRKMS